MYGGEVVMPDDFAHATQNEYYVFMVKTMLTPHPLH